MIKHTELWQKIQGTWFGKDILHIFVGNAALKPAALNYLILAPL